MKKTLLFTLAAVSLCCSVSLSQDRDTVTFTWYGHACFHVETPSGVQILLDPIRMDDYVVPAEVTPDIVTVSHDHFDHNQVEAVSGEPVVLFGMSSEGEDPFRKIMPIDTTLNGIQIYSVESNHFPPEESPYLNAIFVFEFDSLRLVHLGDLGRTLSEEQITAIGRVDILMIPVGGKYTIEPPQMDTLMAQLKPTRLVFPMHYRTRVADFLPYSGDDFVAGKEGVARFEGNTFTYDTNQPYDQPKYILFDCFKEDRD